MGFSAPCIVAVRGVTLSDITITMSPRAHDTKSVSWLPAGVHFTLPTVCDQAVSLGPNSISPPLGCTGNLGRNSFTRPGFAQFDLRVARKIPFRERWNVEVIANAFNLFNRFNVSDVNPVCDPANPSACQAGQPTAALDPRTFQLALKINW